MSKVIIAHRVGLEYPMVRCPLTNIGIYFEKKEWNGNYDHPTFDKDMVMYGDKVKFHIEDGVCIYSNDSDCPMAGMQIILKDWNDPINSSEAGFYKDNRRKYRIGR